MSQDDEELKINNYYSNQQIFDLTSINYATDPWDYFNEDTIPESYQATLYNLRVNNQNVIRLYKIHQDKIQTVVPLMYNDIHSIFIRQTMLEDSPPSDDMIQLWQTCYSHIYLTTKNRSTLNSFLNIIPFFFAFVIYNMYLRLPTPLGIVPPKNFKIARRTIYLFSSITYLNSSIKSILQNLFEPEVKLKPMTPKPSQASVLLPIEDLNGLVDLERRQKDRPRKFALDSVSPLASKIRKDPKNLCNLMYPIHGDKTFKEELKPFSQKEKAPGDFTPDLDTKSLLMRARCRNAQYELQQLEMDAAVKRTKLMHFFQTDREVVETKRAAVLNASPEQKETFIRQLRENHERGNFIETPKITLELLKNAPIISQVAPLSPGVHGKIERIVDNVLSQCAVEQRRQEEVEVHLTHEMRNSIIDVRRAFEPKPRKSLI